MTSGQAAAKDGRLQRGDVLQKVMSVLAAAESDLDPQQRVLRCLCELCAHDHCLL